MYCPNCGKEIKEKISYCRKCGCDLQIRKEIVSNYEYRTENAIRKPCNVSCIVGFVISLIALFVLNLYGLTGAIGMIISACGLYSCKRRNESGKIFAYIGLIIGIISVVYGVISLITAIFLLQETSNLYQELRNLY